jgi:hypothetical protein
MNLDKLDNLPTFEPMRHRAPRELEAAVPRKPERHKPWRRYRKEESQS